MRPADTTTESGPAPLHGPSFLGLGDEPTGRERVSYLLEDDEESSSHRGAYAAVVFILFVAALGLGTWRWRPDLFSRLTKLPASLRTSSTNAPSPSSASPSAPASSSDGSTGDQSAAASPASPGAPSSGTDGSTTSSSPSGTSSTAAAPPAPPSANAANTAAPQTQPTTGEPAPTAAPQETAASQPTAEKPTAKPTRAAANSDPNAEPAAASTNDALEAEGEKYLYGNGVTENCGRAQKDLMAAANHNNAKAQSVLATMYATGHCTGRDLPLAYHWFGKALRQDPTNTRIEVDLKALWNQMTPEERNIALRSEE